MSCRFVLRDLGVQDRRAFALFLRDGGCIDQRVEAKSLRCTLLKIPDQVLGKLQASGVTCSGVMTEVSEPTCFVQCVGPASAPYKDCEVASVRITYAACGPSEIHVTPAVSDRASSCSDLWRTLLLDSPFRV